MYANPAALRFLALRIQAKLSEKRSCDFIQPEFPMLSGKYWKKISKEEIHSPTELRMLRVDGTSILVERSGDRDNNRRETCSSGRYQDITEQRRAEEKLQKSEKTSTEPLLRPPGFDICHWQGMTG